MATGRRRGRAILYIAFIVILLFVLGFVVYSQNLLGPKKTAEVKSEAATAVPTPAKVKIVYTAQDMRRGQELTKELLALVPEDRENITGGQYYEEKDLESLVGTRAKFDLKARTALTKSLVFPKGTPVTIPSFEIPTGKVAISVPISKLSSVAYGLQKGDHVNIIVSLLMVDIDTNFQSQLPNRTGSVIAPGPISENQTFVTSQLQGPPGYEMAGSGPTLLGRIEIDPTMNNPVYLLPSEKQRPRMVSQTLIQDVVILQMGSFSLTSDQTQPVAAPAAGQPGAATPTKAPAAASGSTQTQAAVPAPTIPDTVTLIVSPQDAITLNYLMLAGANLNMVLRSAGDTEIKSTEAVTLQFIMDQYQIPNPAKLPYGTSNRIDAFPEKIVAFPEPSLITPAPPK